MRLYLFFTVFFCALPVAWAVPRVACPGAFKDLLPTENALSMPALSFLPEAELQKIHAALLALAKNEHTEALPAVREAVDLLQAQRRHRVDHVELLRRQRRQERSLIRGGRTTAAEINARQERKKTIDGVIHHLQAELSAIASELIPLRNELGRLTIDAATITTAHETGYLVLLRHTLPNAAGQLAHKGIGKGIGVKFHSAQDGVIAGLIPYQQRLSAKVAEKGAAEIQRMQSLVEKALQRHEVFKVKFKVGSLAAVERGGEIKFVDISKERIDEREIVEVIGTYDETGEGRLLTSDVDPLAFGRPITLPPESALSSASRGVATAGENKVIDTLNRNASKILGHDPRVLMAHGAENRNPHSSGVSGYPITAYFPDGHQVEILEGPADAPDIHLQEFFRDARDAGFQLDVNPLWGW